MKINRFWFAVFLTVSIFVIAAVFALGDLERGYDALGGEVFVLALPFLVIRWREWSIKKALEERNKKRKRGKKMNKFFDDDFTEEEIASLTCKTKNRMEQDKILGEKEKEKKQWQYCVWFMDKAAQENPQV